MSNERHKPAAAPCLCNALRQATRAVSRLYDEELRGVGLRTTQYSLLRNVPQPAPKSENAGHSVWPAFSVVG
jgi:hypothetical protein